MSAGGCSLAGRRDNVPCLAITAIFETKANDGIFAKYCRFLEPCRPGFNKFSKGQNNRKEALWA
jgi:hypothetical protein